MRMLLGIFHAIPIQALQHALIMDLLIYRSLGGEDGFLDSQAIILSIVLALVGGRRSRPWWTYNLPLMG
jgi:hypothetical protein